MATIKVDVVSAEEQIFSGEAKFVALRAKRVSWVFCRVTRR